jgi:uncharacterized protein with PQ loop repeat
MNNNTYKSGILIACNVINVIYHVPQIIKTYRTKSVKDFDSWYLFLGNLHSFCWVLYSIEDNNGLMMFNSCVTMFSISFVSYYKICSFINEHHKKNIIKNEKNIDTNNKTITITSVSCEELNKT